MLGMTWPGMKKRKVMRRWHERADSMLLLKIMSSGCMKQSRKQAQDGCTSSM